MPANEAFVTPKRTDMESFLLFFSCLFIFNRRIIVCNIVLISAIHQQESVLGVCLSPPCWTHLPLSGAFLLVNVWWACCRSAGAQSMEAWAPFPQILPFASLPSGLSWLRPFVINLGSSKPVLSSVSHSSKVVDRQEGIEEV